MKQSVKPARGFSGKVGLSHQKPDLPDRHFSSPTETHSFKKMEFQPAEAKKFFSTVRKEMALLATSLPDGIMVKTFEDRMVGVFTVLVSQKKTLY